MDESIPYALATRAEVKTLQLLVETLFTLMPRQEQVVAAEGFSGLLVDARQDALLHAMMDAQQAAHARLMQICAPPDSPPP
jgi:hypothetical protein